MARSDTPRLTNLQPRGLRRAEVAAYVGVSPGTFDAMVQDGRMPKPKRVNSCKVWDRFAVDEAFADLPDDGAARANSWDEDAA